jgi:signal transduction histidine kinase
MAKPTASVAKLERAGKLLHDEIGPLLSAAGLKLQLIRMDHPKTAPLVEDVTKVLDQAIDQVRELSRTLNERG